MDALSEVLGAIHLDGAVFLDAEFTAPWCVSAQYGLPQETQLLRGADHIALFHFLLDGRCKTRLAGGGEVLELGPGDCVLYPHDHKHILGSDLSLPAVETDILPRTDHGAAQMRHGGGGGRSEE